MFTAVTVTPLFKHSYLLTYSYLTQNLMLSVSQCLLAQETQHSALQQQKVKDYGDLTAEQRTIAAACSVTQVYKVTTSHTHTCF